MNDLKERDIKVALLRSIKNIKETTQHGRLNTDDSSIILTDLNDIMWRLERMETYIKNMLEGPEDIKIKFAYE